MWEIPLVLFMILAITKCFYDLVWESKHRRSVEVDPVLPSEFDDWDAEFLRLTGKTVWEARYEADPELRKSLVIPASAQNDINPFYLAMQQSQQQQQQVALGQQSNIQGLLGGLGNIGGLFH